MTGGKQSNLQVTYSNAMPRLASANPYLSKQARKLKPGPSGQFAKSGFESSQSVKSSSRAIRPIPAEARQQIFNEPVLSHSRAASKSKPIITDQILGSVEGGFNNPGSRSVAASGMNNFQKQYIIAPQMSTDGGD